MRNIALLMVLMMAMLAIAGCCCRHHSDTLPVVPPQPAPPAVQPSPPSAPPTLDVVLTLEPDSGPAPLDTKITVEVSGTATGVLHYRIDFDSNGWDQSFESNNTRYETRHVFPEGLHNIKVQVVREGLTVEGTGSIIAI